MGNNIDFWTLRDNAPIIKIQIAEIEIQLRIFFNVNCCENMFESHQKGDDYRTAFAKSIFYMYQQGADIKTTLTKNDFVNLPDTTLCSILYEILEQDHKVKEEYDNIEIESPYEKFYKAHEQVWESIALGAKKAFEKTSRMLDSLREPLVKSLGNALGNLSNFKMAQTEINQLSNFNQLQIALKSVPQIQFSELTSAISNIPTPALDIQNIVSPLNRMVEVIAESNVKLAETFYSPLLQVEASIRSFMTSIDFSLLTYRSEWNKGRETLLEYGWFYSSELPEEVINHIYENRESLNKDDVDKIVVEYFRKNQCEALKNMVHSWNNLPYFACRKVVFHETLVNHSRKYFNSSITLLAIHTEGVITDFVRTVLQSPRYYVKQAIKDVKEKLENIENMSIYEYEVFNDVIERIEQAFNESFDCGNPDKTSNGSRHKIAHGHVYEKETEVNSLKHFLYMNELYHLFLLLSNHDTESSDSNSL